MEVTQEFADDLVEHMLRMAKMNKERAGYSGNFVQVAVVVGPQGEQGVLMLDWKNNREKRVVMAALAEAARQQTAAAVALVMDARWMLSDKFCNWAQIPGPEILGIDKFSEAYLEILNRDFGGEMKNMPHELWCEALIVAIKGPWIEPTSKLAAYTEGPGGTIAWGGTELDDKDGSEIVTQMNVLPDWWKEPDGKPA